MPDASEGRFTPVPTLPYRTGTRHTSPHLLRARFAFLPHHILWDQSTNRSLQPGQTQLFCLQYFQSHLADGPTPLLYSLKQWNDELHTVARQINIQLEIPL